MGKRLRTRLRSAGAPYGLYPSLALDFSRSTTLDSRVTFSRASAATYYDSTGTLQTAATNAARFDYDPTQYYPNLLTYPESFDNAVWVKARASVSANATTAPNGLATADKLIEDTTASNSHFVEQAVSTTNGTTYTFSFYAKAGERTSVVGQFFIGATTGVVFNLANGTITSGTAGTITAAGNGWYRCTVTATATATGTGYFDIFLYNGAINYTGDGSSGAFIWGAKLEPGSTATTYDNMGLVSQNLLLQSNNFASTWYTSNVTPTANTTDVTDPNGTNTATKFVIGGSSGAIGQALTSAQTVPYTSSIYLRTDAGTTNVDLVWYRSSPFAAIATKTVTLTTAWQRVDVTGTALDTTQHNFQINLGTNKTVYSYGGQLNLGHSPLPYTATTTAAVTQCVPRGLLVEEQRTNSIRNNTMVGAVAGSPGTMATNWSTAVNTTTGLTRTIVGTGTENGVSYIDIRYSGTSVGAGSVDFFFETSSGVAASNGQTWVASTYWKLQAGSFTGLSGPQLYFYSYTSVPAFLTAQGVALTLPTGASLTSQRISGSVTLNGGATTAYVNPIIKINIADATAIDFTIRFGMPQLELGAFATSVISTSSAAATRAGDFPLSSGSSFSGWYAATGGTFAIEFASASGSAGRLMVLNNGTTGLLTNGVSVDLTSATNARSEGFAGGVSQWGLARTYTAGIPQKLALAMATNDIAMVVNGGTVTTDTSATVPTTDVSALQIGYWGTANQLNGWIRRISYYPTRLSNSTLQSLTS